MNDNRGLDLMGLMFLVFLTLKLIGTITWSWWWVTLPLWGGVALAIAGVLAYLGFMGLMALFMAIVSWRHK